MADSEIAAEQLTQSEECFRLLVDGVRDYAIYMLDPKGFVTTWNAGAQRIKGYHAEEIVGKHFSCFYTPEDIRTGQPVRTLAITVAAGRYEAESLRVRKDGSIFWANVLVTPLLDPEGKLYGFAKVVRDITERKEIEQQLREKERLATLGTTAAVVAHEIGNALNGLSTSLQIMTTLIETSNRYDAGAAETIEIADREMRRLTSLLNDYRAFAKPQSLNLEPTDLRQITEEVLAPVIKSYAASGVSVKFNFPEALPLIPADQEKMKQVILNLCKNAMEAMPDGGTLTCKAYQLEERINLEISDSGVGVSDGLDVFQLFKTTKPYGTGLGLPIVEQIVRDHNGTIYYVTENGKGTTFIVSFPLSQREITLSLPPESDRS
jgi:PAS domain S-box-containing protein